MEVTTVNRNARILSVLAVVVVVLAGVGPAMAAGATTSGAGTAADGATSGASDAFGGASSQLEDATCSFPVSVTDATGQNVTVEGEPDKVVALGANVAQIAWALGVQNKIVGMPVNPTTAYLNGSENRTDIYKADNFHVATETVVGLEPDLVLAPNIIDNETVSTLRDAGLTVVRSPFGKSVTDAYGAVNQTGRLLGACGAANRTVEMMQTRVNAIESAVTGEDRPSVLYGTNYVAGNGTFVGEIIEDAGGTNLAAEANITGYKKISDEVVVQRDPEWLVVTNASTVPTTGAFANTTAVRQNQTVVVDDNYANQIGPMIVQPMTEIARALHPDAIAGATLSNVSNVSFFTNGAAAMNGTNGTTGANTSNASTTIQTSIGTTMGNATTTGTTTMMTPSNHTSPENGSNATETTSVAASETETTAGGEAATTTNATTAAGTTTAAETTGGNGPGFGIVVAAIAVLAAGLLAARRRP